MASADAKPFSIKNAAYRITFPILDADGDLVTGAADLDSEISKDGGTFADCTNEATQIATSSGMYYLDLTAAEMNADTVAIIVKTSTSGAKTTPIVLYPVENTDIPVNVKAIGDTVQSATDLKDLADTGYDPSAHRTQAQVKGLDDGLITAAKIATDAITAAKIAANAIGSSEFAQAAADKAKANVSALALASVCTEARLAHLDADISSRSNHAAVDVRKSVCAADDPLHSIGRRIYDYLDAAISEVGSVVGPGALSCTWTQKDDDENPMDNVQVWITTDEAGVNVIAGTLLTDAQGQATFMLDEGTYYVWREKAGKNFTNPQTWSVN